MKKIFIILFFLIFVFFLFFDKNWLYIDNGWFPLTDVRKWDIIFSFFDPLRQGTYFGYDEYTLQSSRFFGNFFIIGGEFLLFYLFFIVNFLSSYLLLKIFFSKKSSIFGALFYTFNPISFLFLNLSGFIFSYTSFPLILFSVYKIFTTKRWIYILLFIFSLYFFISYTRISGLYFTAFFLLAIYYYKEIFRFIKNNILFSFSIFVITFISFLPFLFSLFYPYIDGQKDYFSGLGNYSQASYSWAEGFYNTVKYSPFYNLVSFKEITENFGNNFYTSTFFILFSFSFITFNIILSFFIKDSKNNKFLKFVSILFLLFLFLLSGAKFLSFEIFSDIAYKYFPFISNNSNWLYVILIPLFVYILTFVLENIKSEKFKNILKVFVIFYIFLVFYPIINFSNNDKLALMNLRDFPKDYQKTFHNEKIEKEPSLFFPSHNLYFNWSKYPLSLFNNNSYVSLLSDNSRLVNSKQSKIANLIIELRNKDFIYNNFIFNLKNIFVFKDVKNPKEGQFDFYPVKNYVLESKKYYKELAGNKNFYIKQDNKNFVQFGIKGDDKYEFFLYSPAKIEKYDLKKFFSEKNNLKISEKPINIDKDSFNKPKEISNFKIPKENQNISIKYKKSVLQPTKIYAKIENFDKTKPFLLQLNQTFGMSWKLKWIEKEDFDEKNCIDDYKNFEITQNSFCNYQAKILDFKDIKFLNKIQLPESQHFEGNFVGNTWFIKPENIQENLKNEKELYVVIIYEKQIWYNFALLISGLTFGILVLFTVLQEIKNFRKKIYEK